MRSELGASRRRWLRGTRTSWAILTFGVLVFSSVQTRAIAAEPDPSIFFAIEIVDEQTGRGVPMVELQTTSGTRYYSDSNGLVAFYEPGLMGKKVFFAIDAHGYEYPKDGFGIRGAALEAKPGGGAKLKIKRINVAERLYRITGQGIYRDTILLGRKAPIEHPLLNSEVTGQDSVLTATYRGRIYWFYGDTNKLSYALGNFSTSGATSPAPSKVDPSVGLNLTYFIGKDGFSRPMAPIKGEGVVWISAVVVLPDESGRERMLAFFERRRGLGAVLESGFLMYNDETETFEKMRDVPLNPIFTPTGQTSVVKQDGGDYIHFTAPYPWLRVKADMKSYLDLASYEAYTCLMPGTSSDDRIEEHLERDAQGKLAWGWKKGTRPLDAKRQQQLIANGKMKLEESPFRLKDPDKGTVILLNNSSCHWNEYRKKYIMIASQVMGATVLGEIWFAEADRPEGPWAEAHKIITHANKKGDAHDFYNPTQHPFFDQDGGRIIYLEGTYVNTFSGNVHPTPYYEYNQIMYRLDLSDPRLKPTVPPSSR